MPSSRTSLGNWGEGLARRMLERLGYQVLETNYRCRWGEVDLVVRDGEETVFVEVRTRSSSRFGNPEESITKAKAQHLISTAEDYLQNRADASANWRIDLVSVRLSGNGRLQSIDHLKNAIEA